MKIAIVGGSISGFYLAWKLSPKNSVTVFEQNKKIGKKSCSGLISERLWDFIPRNYKLIQNRINTSVIHLPKKQVRLDFKPKMLVINRPALDRYMASLARKAGANIIFRKVEEMPKGYDFIIGCDGALSVVRKLLNLPDPKFRLGIKCIIKEKDGSREVHTWPIKQGFAWRIPRRESVEYGVMASPERAKLEFTDFCLKNNINPETKFSGLIPQGLIVSNRRRIALCGDAAGLTKPHTGGGVIWGLISADILLKTFPVVKNYNRALKTFFNSKIFNIHLANKIGTFFGTNLPQILPESKTIDSDFLF